SVGRSPGGDSMRRILKVLLVLVVLLLLAAGAALGYLYLHFPAVGAPPAIKVARTPEQIARGAYLANHVNGCLDCHSKKDEGRYSGPVVAGTLGEGGGEGLTRAQGFPGEVFAPNITPAALASWSDGEVMRAFTEGVSRDGHPLFALMPYEVYRNVSQEDAEAL